tara:strand:+ start:35681 stop:37927 length:2247 start_codon:yes stop_codon:yes gene_type:complete
MSNLKNLLAALLLFFIVNSNAQNIDKDLNGIVLNSKNMPIENAYIYNKTTNSHTHSNNKGKFILKNNFIGDTVQIGLLGYNNFEIILKKNALENSLPIVLVAKRIELEELIISKDIDPIQTISKIDLNANPVNSSQEILRTVPGLFIGQHAGGGKAEQLFLRGFDVDHGTDVSISVDGMPVNMVSHAHGQGYSDLHFVIPETIQKIAFGKGPYYANQGDFNTAGFVSFSTKKQVEENQISVGLGDFNSIRTLAMFNLLEDKNNENAYVAFEYIETDGPFESPQNFTRTNFFTKYTKTFKNFDQLSLTLSHFTSNWDASGQIPQRAVDNGTITRFGAIDDTEGGKTSRTNFNIQHSKTLQNESILTTNVFFSKYNFELYSNFTFFLDDPINGDQIRQFEEREIFGFNSVLSIKKTLENTTIKLNKGFGIRFDKVDNIELSKTLNRSETLENIQLGDIKQRNLYSFLDAKIELGDFEFNPSVRLDYFNFQYNNQLQTLYETKSKNKAIVNPKLNIAYNANNNLQLFVKSGIGFHSNDARVILQEDTRKLLPRAYGLDVGTIWKPSKNVVINSALWYLLSEEELVYVGDAGIIEPSGKSRRYGFDLGVRYQISDSFYFDTDATYTVARSLEEISGQDYIPLAPDFTLSGGLSFQNIGNFSGGLRYRYLDTRPANEDNTIEAKGYFVTDFNLNYKMNTITLGFAVENIFNVKWNETQFATTSRLQNEVASVTEIHFTPGTPLFAKATLIYNF